MPFALLPPMETGPRIILGLLGTFFGGLLNVKFRSAKIRSWQFVVALLISPMVVVISNGRAFDPGQPTGFVFLGAMVGVLIVRGSRHPVAVPGLLNRILVVFCGFIVLGPVVGLLAHYLRYLSGGVQLLDDWEIGLSLEDGVIASSAGCLITVVMALGSASWQRPWGLDIQPKRPLAMDDSAR